MNGIAPTPTVPAGLAVKSPLVALLGVLWLAATIGFLTATVGVVVTASWRRIVMTEAALLSLALCLAWWNDARAGVVIDVAILAGLAFSAWNARAREP